MMRASPAGGMDAAAPDVGTLRFEQKSAPAR